MAGYVVRIALPDRPGALGLVASRIGAVGGDIVAINILEREEGQAVDEFDQTVVMVTHDAHAASFADRLLVLADGRIMHDRESASTEEALDLMKSVG